MLRAGNFSGPSGGVTSDKAGLLETGQPAVHGPPAPTPVKDPCVAHDVVDMLDGRVTGRVELMERMGPAHPLIGTFCAAADCAKSVSSPP